LFQPHHSSSASPFDDSVVISRDFCSKDLFQKEPLVQVEILWDYFYKNLFFLVGLSCQQTVFGRALLPARSFDRCCESLLHVDNKALVCVRVGSRSFSLSISPSVAVSLCLTKAVSRSLSLSFSFSVCVSLFL